MANLVDSNRSPSPPASPWANARLFAFAGVTLGTFFFGLYLIPTAVRGYVARAVLGLQVQTSDKATATNPSREQQCQIRDEILSAEQLRATLSQIGPPPHSKRIAGEGFPNVAEVEYVRQRLAVSPEKAQSEGEARLVLSFTELDSTWSVLLLDRLANLVVANLEERADKVTESSMNSEQHAGLVAAKQKEQAARRALDDFLSSHFDALNRAGKPAADGLAGKEAKSAEPTIPMPRINPKWQSLCEQLSTLSAEREKILLDRTPEHPQATEAAVKIEALRRQLEQTPKFLVDEEPSLSAARRSTKTIRPVQFTAAHSPSVAGREYERLLAELRLAREQRSAAEREVETNAKSTSRPALPGAAVVRGRVVVNAHLAQTLREATSSSRLTLLALGSIFLGACVAALIRLPQAMPVYATLAQVEKDLSLPVVGVVSPASHSAAALSR